MTKLKVRKNGKWEWVQMGLTPHPIVTGVSLQEIDGGANYYANKGFTKAVAFDTPSFFPIGVWYESVLSQQDIDNDKDAGINTYVELTSNSDMSFVRGNGMHAITSYPAPTNSGDEIVGWITSDETDMQYPVGYGNGQGYKVQQDIVANLPVGDGRFHYSNYGKGVLLRSWSHPYATKVYLNNFQQTVSNDFYWYTDKDIYTQTNTAPWNQAGQYYDMLDRDLTVDEVRRPCHYGNVVARMRQFIDPYRWEPVWGFVENGGPFPNNDNVSEYMDPDVMKAAVWHMIIAGARGIIYFNHSFGGPYQGQHNFRAPEYANIRLAAKEVNSRVTQLASVLNSPFAVNFATVTPLPSMVNGIESMAKYDGNKFYIFAASRESVAASTALTATVTIPNGVGTTATVLFENRTIPIVNGQFTDPFANGNSVHIYRID